MEVGDVIIAKICSNMGMIFSNKGYLSDALKMHQKALEHKQKVFPQFDEEILNSQLMVASAFSKISDFDSASSFFKKAFETCKNTFGEFNKRTANLLVQHSECLLSSNKFSETIKMLEHAGMILCRLENQKSLSTDEKHEATISLYKVYLQLVHLYMLVNKLQDA